MPLPTLGRLTLIPVAQLDPNPSQPRRRFDPAELAGLAASIRESGLLQPVTARRAAGRFELISGERRLEAVRSLAWQEIPAILIETEPSRSAELALVENIQRADLTAFEQADAIRSLRDSYGETQEEIARRLGLSQSAVANKLRLLTLSPEARAVCEAAHLSERHARALLRLPPSVQAGAANTAAARGLTVAQTERLVETCLAAGKPPPRRKIVLRDARLFVNTIDKTVASIRRMGIEVSTDRRQENGWLSYTLRVRVSGRQ